MKRLTEVCWRNLDPWECCGQDKYCHRGPRDLGGCTGGCIVPKLYARLAAYEDTGLTPEQVKVLATTHDNTPLTLEELRNMDGQPIWVVNSKSNLADGFMNEWAIVDITWEHAESLTAVYHFENYGDLWLAYRRKPDL